MLIHIAEIGLAWVIAAGLVAWAFAAFMQFGRTFAKEAAAEYQGATDQQRTHRA